MTNVPAASTPDQRRIMLLITARSYRSQAFRHAATKASVTILPVIDMDEQLAEYWHVPLGVSFDRPDEAVAAIVEQAAQTPVDAILAVDDSGTLIAAQASALLGLQHNSPDAALAARDKYRMRSLMHAAGVPCPTFRRFSIYENPGEVAQQVEYPCVIKPLNLNGSRGVMRADNPAQFVTCAQRLLRMLEQGRSGAASVAYLVEAFIPGMEVALEGMLDRGALAVLALFDKPDPMDGPYFEETIYVTPSRLPDAVQNEIAACAAGAAHALGLRTGPVHAELRVNERGPWMLEIAGRSIGGLCAETLRFDMDMSLEELIIRQACGLAMPALTQPQNASGVMMIPIPEAGVLRAVEGIGEAKDVAGIDGVEITAKLNYPLVPLPEGDSYLGFIFARDDTPVEVEAALRTAHARLHFHIVPEFSLTSWG